MSGISGRDREVVVLGEERMEGEKGVGERVMKGRGRGLDLRFERGGVWDIIVLVNDN